MLCNQHFTSDFQNCCAERFFKNASKKWCKCGKKPHAILERADPRKMLSKKLKIYDCRRIST